MHYYPHNIPDFNNGTRHLTRVERSVYRDAIEMYYDTESPLPSDDFDRLARHLLCKTDEEKDALRLVLDDFFELRDGAYHHDRCDSEIESYRVAVEAKSRAGKASADARRKKKEEQKGVSDDAEDKQDSTHDEQVLNTCTTDEQLTKNQELRTNISPKPPRGRKPAIEIQTFIDQCKAEGVKTLPPDDPVFKLAEEAGIPSEFLRLAWVEFKDHCQANKKRQSDWRKTFRNYVRGNYLKLWYLDDNKNYQLTTVGKQAETRFGERA